VLRTLLLTGIVLISLPIQTVARELRVGVSGSPPFVMDKDGELSGISIEIWRDVANRLDQPYKFVVQPNTNASIKAVADGTVDLAIGPISITPNRLANPKIDFTQPYFHGYEGLLIPQKPPGLITRLRPFIGWAALSSVGILVSLLFIFGNLIWLAERRKKHRTISTPVFPWCWKWNVVWARYTHHSRIWRSSTTFKKWSDHCRDLDGDVACRRLINHRRTGIGIYLVSRGAGSFRNSKQSRFERKKDCSRRGYDKPKMG